MLVDHRDAVGDGVGCRRDRDSLAVEPDLPVVGAQLSGEDAHQRGLAGTVLANDRGDGASANGQFGVGDGDHRPK